MNDTDRLQNIQAHAKSYADARTTLKERVQSLRDEIDGAKRRKLPGIQSAVANAKAQEEALATVLRAAPDLFVSPRSITAHGIKVGWGKAKGKIAWADTNTVVERIGKFFKDRFDVLVKTTRKPIRKALGQLSVDELKRIGCTVTADADDILIKPTDGDIEKLVAQLLAAETTQDEDEEAA